MPRHGSAHYPLGWLLPGNSRGGWAHREPDAILFDGVDSDDENIVTPSHPRNRRDRHCHGDVEGCASCESGRSADFKWSAEPKGLLSGQAWYHERIPVLVVDSELGRMSCIGLVPLDFDDTCDRERLRSWARLVPGAAQKKEKPFADFRAVRQQDSNPHALSCCRARSLRRDGSRHLGSCLKPLI